MFSHLSFISNVTEPTGVKKPNNSFSIIELEHFQSMWVLIYYVVTQIKPLDNPSGVATSTQTV